MNRNRAADRLESIRCDAYNDDPLRVARVARLVQSLDADEPAGVFSALGHPVRVRIAQALLAEPLCVCELSALLRMSPPAIMHHLKAMAAAGILDVKKAGRFAEYHISDPRVADILDAIRRAPASIGGYTR